MRYLIFIFILLSCKKETKLNEAEQTKTETKTFSVTASGAKTQIVKLNGGAATPPLTVKTGDQVYVNYACQPSTPTTYELYVTFYLDGVKLSQCQGCTQYQNTFNIQ